MYFAAQKGAAEYMKEQITVNPLSARKVGTVYEFIFYSK